MHAAVQKETDPERLRQPAVGNVSMPSTCMSIEKGKRHILTGTLETFI